MIDFQFLNTKSVKLKYHKEWLKKVIVDEKKKAGDITYIFCNDNHLLEKNIKFLNHYDLTDTISFDYSTKDLVSGDIFISLERVKENSIDYNVNFLDELDRVMVHGLLHLLGYKDKTKKQINKMIFKENIYLEKR